MATIRKEITDALRPHLPKTWKIVPAQRNTDTINAVTVILKQTTVQPHPAQQVYYLTTMVVTLVDPHTDITAAEDALDNNLETLIKALHLNPVVRFNNATKVNYNDTNLAYDVEIQIDTDYE